MLQFVCLLVFVQDLEAQQEATANFKAFGYDKSGLGVSDAEWRLNRGLLKVCCGICIFCWNASKHRAIVACRVAESKLRREQQPAHLAPLRNWYVHF